MQQEKVNQRQLFKDSLSRVSALKSNSPNTVVNEKSTSNDSCKKKTLAIQKPKNVPFCQRNCILQFFCILQRDVCKYSRINCEGMDSVLEESHLNLE